MVEQLSAFRSDLYNVLSKRADAVLDLVDALSSTSSASSVVELSLSGLFRREYPSVYDAVEHLFIASSADKETKERLKFRKKLLGLGASFIAKPITRNFLLFGVDGVSIPRLYADTLDDRSFVHQPTVIRGNKPITIGHSYSTLAFLPESVAGDYSHWIFPLSMQRVTSDQKATEVAQEQFQLLFNHDEFTLKDHLSVTVGDTAYSTPAYLCSNYQHKSFVTIDRLRSNRKLYRPYEVASDDYEKAQGHPRWYGEKIHVNDETLWQTPGESITVLWTTKRGKCYTVTVSGISNLRMRGKKNISMHDKPLKLVRILVTDEQGKAVYQHPIYLVICGQRQNELTLQEIYDAFKERFNLEHFFRFGKQRLLLARSQTPILQSEENWCDLVVLAYQQLFLARQAAKEVRKPWERKTDSNNHKAHTAKSPSQTQRDFERIIREIGTPAKPPKTRNKPNGRAKGFQPTQRVKVKVLKKT